MFFIGNDTIVKIDRIPGESNKAFFKRGYYVANQSVTNENELKTEMTKYYNKSFTSS